MANLSKLSSLGGLAVAGAALGLYLGSSAISEINPAYYSTPVGSSFHADLVPNSGDRDSAQPLPEIAEAVTDLGRTCVSCSLNPDEYAVADYPSPGIYGSYGPAPADIVLAEADEHVSRGLSSQEARDIERYAHFRVSEEDESPALAVRSQAAEEAGDGEIADRDAEEAAPGI